MLMGYDDLRHACYYAQFDVLRNESEGTAALPVTYDNLFLCLRRGLIPPPVYDPKQNWFMLSLEQIKTANKQA